MSAPGLKYTLYKWLWRQPWLPAALKRTLYKLARKSGDVFDVPFSTDFFGLRYEGNLNNNVEFNVYFHGAFEKPLLFFLRDTLLNVAAGKQADSRTTLFWDVGANVGQHSLFMSRFASQVHAFEPFPRVCKRLERHLALNDIDNVMLHKVGLGDRDGELSFFRPAEGHNQGVGSFDAGTTVKGNVEAGKYPLRHGDRYRAGLHDDPVDLIKIDVEGFEKKVITGLRETLQRDRPILVCEVSYANPLSFASMADLLAALPADYRLMRFDTRKAGDGSKARRRGRKARKTGDYEIVPLERWAKTGQDDVIACPVEKSSLIPHSRLHCPPVSNCCPTSGI